MRGRLPTYSCPRLPHAFDNLVVLCCRRRVHLTRIMGSLSPISNLHPDLCLQLVSELMSVAGNPPTR